MASERIVGLYEDNAAAWDVQRGRDLFEQPWLERFRALLPDGGGVLDLGCGSGQPIARGFIERVRRLPGRAPQPPPNPDGAGRQPKTVAPEIPTPPLRANPSASRS